MCSLTMPISISFPLETEDSFFVKNRERQFFKILEMYGTTTFFQKTLLIPSELTVHVAFHIQQLFFIAVLVAFVV